MVVIPIAPGGRFHLSPPVYNDVATFEASFLVSTRESAGCTLYSLEFLQGGRFRVLSAGWDLMLAWG